jgi:Mrp family chromosome partitioning ATPase
MFMGVAESELYQALSRVIHPEFEEHDLVELGMISQIKPNRDVVQVTLALPFPQVPIKEQLIELVRAAVTGVVGGQVVVEVRTVQMAPEQKAAFMARVRGEEAPAATNRISHVIAVASGKGGVGKSSLTGLLAAALRRDGLQVGVLDADITGPSMPKMFGVHQLPLSTTQEIQPAESQTGIKLMSINLLLADEEQAVVWRGPLISRVIEQFWRDIAWGELDYLIVDLPPGTSDAALTVTQSLPLRGIVLVTTPQDLAGMVVRKAANMAEHLGIPVIGLVENMSYAICPQCGSRLEVFGPSRAAATAARIGTRLLGNIPLDAELATLCDAGRIEGYHSDEIEDIKRSVREFATHHRSEKEIGL